MNCSVAIQFLPMDSKSDEETFRVVDAVIAYIASTGVSYFVGPFETAIEGDYDLCMEVLAEVNRIVIKAGADKVATYAKIFFAPERGLLTTEQKVGKYHGREA